MGFYRFIIDFESFWSILGEFWAAILEPVWRPRRLKIGKTSIFVPFLRASKRKAVSDTILGDFLGAWRGKNEQKCGSVCSDSLFSLRNIRSILDTFSTGFWEGLGSILGGFSVSRAKKWASGAI